MYKSTVVMLTLAVLMSASPLQAAAPAPAENVLTRVPASAVAVVVVRNVGETGARVDQFLRDIGVGEMLPGGVLAMLKTQLLIDAGFNDNGGLALMAIDPAKYGWDIPALLTDESDALPDAPPPLAMLVPGDDPERLLANYNPVKEGNYVRVVMDGGAWDLYAKRLGGYTVLAPSTQLIDAVVDSDKPATAKIPKAHQETLAKLDLGVYLDWKALAPIYNAAMERTAKQMQDLTEDPYAPSEAKAILNLYAGMLPLFKDMVMQMEAESLGVRIAKTAVLVEEHTTWLPDSLMGKAMASTQTPAGALLSKLPALPYVLAIGCKNAEPADPVLKAQMRQMGLDLLDKMLASEALGKVPPQTRERLRMAAVVLDEQTVGMQMYGGGSTGGSGLFGLSIVLDVKDAATAKAALAELTDVTQAFIRALVGEDAAEFSMTYTAAAAQVGEMPVDAIKINFPELAKMDDEERQEMIKALGSDQLALYVAEAGPKTLVVTFGGGTPFLGQAVKAAQSPKPMESDPEVAKVMAELPKNPMAVILFNPANLLDVINSGIQTMGGGDDNPLAGMVMQTRTPVALGASVADDGVRSTLYVPTALIGEIVAKVQEVMAKMMMGIMGPQGEMDPDF